MKHFVALFLLLLGMTLRVSAQQNTNAPNQSQAKRQPPNFILVMLHLSTNKIEAMRKLKMSKDIEMVMQGDEEINQSVMHDFAAHFTFCPVYFFYDTCFEKARSKRWDEITFYDYESLRMKKYIAADQFVNYFFAEVGYKSPGEQLEINENVTSYNVDQLKGDEDATASRNYGINLYDENFKVLRNKLAFTDISLREKGPLFGAKKMVFIGAEKFQERLTSYYNKSSEKDIEH